MAWPHRRRFYTGIEGYVAKDPGSPYVAGRSLKWLKVKVPKYREEERE
jgi:ATP-dependent DNA ligase